MIKLIDLLQEEKIERRNPFQTTKTDINPETGQITWDINYDALTRLNKALEELSRSFDIMAKRYPQDNKLQKYAEDFKNFKKKIRMHITKNYNK